MDLDADPNDANKNAFLAKADSKAMSSKTDLVDSNRNSVVREKPDQVLSSQHYSPTPYHDPEDSDAEV